MKSPIAQKLKKFLPPTVYSASRALYMWLRDCVWILQEMLSFKKRYSMENLSWYDDLEPEWSKKNEPFRAGDYATGFKYLSRKLEQVNRKRMDILELKKTGIVLKLSGGFGDVLQFLRFAKVLHDHGVAVTIKSTPKYRPLETLLNRQPYISTVVNEVSAQMPQIHLRSVPYVFGVDLSNLPTEKYISTNLELVDTYKKHTAKDPKFKIGIQFTCSTEQQHLNRRIDPELFKMIRCDASFYSLERDNIEIPIGLNLIQLGEKRTFEESAAIAQNMDLIITIETAMPHLVGGMHLPTWLLLPHPCPSWRWYMNKFRTLWYPTMLIFRQSKNQPWSEVFIQLNNKIASEYES